MSHIIVGNAPDSWGVWFPNDPKQVGWRSFLDEVAAAGYAVIELGPWGYLPTQGAELRRELEARQLRLVASTVGCNLLDDGSVEGLLATLPEITTLQKQLGAEFVVLLPAMFTELFSGHVVLPKTISPEERRRFNANIARIGKVVKDEHGLTLTAHPHVDSHLETEADIDSLLSDTDARYVSLCLDVGHHAYGGGDACAYLRKHIDRIPYIHLKNCDGAVLEEMRAKNWSFAEAVKHNIMCEPWKGMVDFGALKHVLDEVGFHGFAVVEQDMYPAPADRPFPIAKATREYLQNLGIG